MIPFLIGAWILTLPCLAQIYETPWSQLITTKVEGKVDIHFRVLVHRFEGDSEVSYFPMTYLTVDGQDSTGALLQPSPDEIQFLPGQHINGTAQPYLASPNPPGRLARLVAYNWRLVFPGNRIFAEPVSDPFTNKTEVLIGFSRDYQGQPHYGWIRLQREVTRIEDFIGPDYEFPNYSFLPVGVAEHPVPGLPIRAGFPPELPPIDSEVIDGGSEPSMLRVRWPEGMQGVRLEQATELADPTVWVAVPDVQGNEAMFLLPDEGQLYFRLNHVP